MHQSNYSSRSNGNLTSVLLLILALTFALSACVRSESDDAPITAANPPPVTPPGSPPGTPPGDPVPPPVDPNPPIIPPPATDQAAFELHLYPVLVDANNFCIGCHGVDQIPTFAVADSAAAYAQVVSQQKVNLANPIISRLYLRPAVDRHNCGGDVLCDGIAAAILAGIQGWAGDAPAPDPTMVPLMSSTTTFAAGVLAGLARVETNVIAMFKFDEGSGDITVDSSGVGTPITLQLTGMEWVEGGLKNVSGRALASMADSRKLFDMITATNAYTVEAWIVSDNNAQDGPARIVSYSQDSGTRNFTVGQNAIYYQLRNRSSDTGVNGTPALEALDPQVATSLQHVVTTFDSTGRKVYINGLLSIEENLAGITLDWLDTQILVLGNEVDVDRLWQGTFNRVAIHNAALTAAEVQQNFDAGAGNIIALRFDVASLLGAPAYIEMQAEVLDPFSYVFAKPVYVSDVTGIQVKNIRIAVNGSVPVAAQTFRRVDMTLMQSGVELSPLGAVIPAELGLDNDQFQLEFEVLGGQFGLTEPIAPSAPPVPLADVPEPDLGVRSFSQLNDTMSSLTGIPATNGTVSARYAELRESLPASFDLLAFASAQQIAIQRLATTYCGEIVANDVTCGNFFGLGTCDIGVNEKDVVANSLYDKLIGDNIVNQPARAGVSAAVISTLDDLQCLNGCNGATAETALNAACAAVLSSGAVTVN